MVGGEEQASKRNFLIMVIDDATRACISGFNICFVFFLSIRTISFGEKTKKRKRRKKGTGSFFGGDGTLFHHAKAVDPAEGAISL